MKRTILIALLSSILLMGIMLAFVVVDSDWEKSNEYKSSPVHGGLWEQDTVENLDRFDVSYGTGRGLNLLLIANIPNECYVKELLEMYSNYTNGNLTRNVSGTHLSVGGLLGIQCNETGWYDSTNALPKSWLPWDPGKNAVVWNESYSTFNAGDMLLAKVNSNMVNSTYYNADPNKIPYNVNGMASAPGTTGERDIGPFQINKNAFGVYNGSDTMNACKTRFGYGFTSSDTDRLSDIFYLPDVLQYFDNRLDEISNCFLPADFGNLSPKVLDCMYSRYHNGGSGSFMYGTFGLPSSGAGISVGASKMREYSEDSTYVWKEIESMCEEVKNLAGYDKIPSLIYNQRNQKIIAGYLAVKNDYIFSKTAFNTFFDDSSLPNDQPNLVSCTGRQTAYVVGLLEGKEFASENDVTETYVQEVRARFLSCVRSLNGTGYATDVGYNDASINSNGYGTVVKVFDRDTTIYGGTDKLGFAMNMVHFGHMLSTCVAGDIQYAITLKYAGVDVDPTNPDTYFDQYREDGEWTPSLSLDFLDTLDIDSSNLSDLRKKVLAYANTYNDGKHPYWLGGEGIVLDTSTYDYLYSKTSLSSGNKRRAPAVFAKNPDGSLVYEGVELFDCSSFVSHVFKETIGLDLPAYSGSLLTSRNLELLPNKAEVQAGDLMVMPGHTGIVLKYDSSTRRFTMLEQAPECIQIMSHKLGEGAYKGEVGFYRPKMVNY